MAAIIFFLKTVLEGTKNNKMRPILYFKLCLIHHDQFDVCTNTLGEFIFIYSKTLRSTVNAYMNYVNT